MRDDETGLSRVTTHGYDLVVTKETIKCRR